jgi:hypothetical protein
MPGAGSSVGVSARPAETRDTPFLMQPGSPCPPKPHQTSHWTGSEILSPPKHRYMKPRPRCGEVAEWLNAPHSKCGMGATPSGVQIPPSPPLHFCKALKCLNNSACYYPSALSLALAAALALGQLALDRDSRAVSAGGPMSRGGAVAGRSSVPHCGSVSGKHYDLRKTRVGLRKCSDCHRQFTVKVGTAFARRFGLATLPRLVERVVLSRLTRRSSAASRASPFAAFSITR